MRRLRHPLPRCGKLVIATDPSEMAALDELERRGNANGLTGLRRIGAEEINEIEPAAAGLAALHVPEAGVADYPALGLHTSRDSRRGSQHSHRRRRDRDRALGGRGGHRIDQRYVARTLVNCAGLHSDQSRRWQGSILRSGSSRFVASTTGCRAGIVPPGAQPHLPGARSTLSHSWASTSPAGSTTQ